MKKIAIFILILITLSVTGLVVYSKPRIPEVGNFSWEKIAPGIEYSSVDYKKFLGNGKIHALKISEPRKLKLLIDNKRATTLENLEKKYKPLVTINGSFFQENFKPSGLLVIDNKNLYGLNKYGGSGILALNKSEVNIFHKNEFNKIKNTFTSFMQNGPLLVEDNGKMGIYSNDREYTARTAIGISKDNKIIITVADMSASPSLWELSYILSKSESEGGLECKIALNLDGGTSTGLRINTSKKRLIVNESSFIANGIGVF